MSGLITVVSRLFLPFGLRLSSSSLSTQRCWALIHSSPILGRGCLLCTNCSFRLNSLLACSLRLLSLGWLLLRLLGRFCRACRFRGSLISLPLVLASLTGCGVLLRLLLSFCLLGGWGLQRLGLLSASGVVALLRQVGTEV